MAFKRTGSQDDLRAGMSEEQLAQHATEYRASQGGWYPVEDKPVPGTPQEDARKS